jgi:hypothetical protein
MDNQPEQVPLNVHITTILNIATLCLGFIFLGVGYFFASNRLFLFSNLFFVFGFIGIIYGAVKVKLNNTGHFFVGFIGWLIFSLLANMFIVFNFTKIMFRLFKTKTYIGDIGFISILVIIQLLGYCLTIPAFRRNKRWIGIGIITASVPYILGYILHDNCGLLGLPFPLSLISFC